ncbi:cysteine--tRNA ligase [Candidatus Woesearchaeota archaeon]|nr:cysteine--tRNA ligase [Candidatus Woesearchaeota archaeon]
MALQIFDSLKKKKIYFNSIEPNKIKMYTCGPTVYNDIHIGNAKTFIIFDFIKRCLMYIGYEVIHVQNITDVGHLVDDSDDGDDKILKQAKKEKIDPYEIARKYEINYKKDMADLGIIKPDYEPRATDFIQKIIDFIKILIEKDFAYQKNGSVYFSVNKFNEYGKLSGNKLDELKQDASERTIKLDEKEDPRDFSIWKEAESNHLMQWDSPWGSGFPGWHIECSVMAKDLLGETFDIKSGGIDLKFPHHEDEIAQSECCNGKEYANYYMHSEHMLIDGEKMSKSKGTFYTARELIEKYGAGAVRLALISNNYRQQINFSNEFIIQSKKIFDRYIETYNRLQKLNNLNLIENNIEEKIKNEIDNFNKNIIEAINDDFNNSIIISQTTAFLKLVNNSIENNEVNNNIKNIFNHFYIKIDQLMNLLKYNIEIKIPNEIKELAKQRDEARNNKDWPQSDILREKILKLGYAIKDSKEGTIIIKNENR